MSDDEWENHWDNSNTLNILNENTRKFVDIQSQIKLLENREMEEKADNILMNDLFSNDTFKIEKDDNINYVKNNDIKQSNDKQRNDKHLNKKINNDYKIKNYYKNKELNENKKKELIKIKNNKTTIKNNKKDIFGEYEDDNLDMYCNIEDKYIK